MESMKLMVKPDTKKSAVTIETSTRTFNSAGKIGGKNFKKGVQTYFYASKQKINK